MEITPIYQISRAIAVIRPNAEWVMRGDDFANLEWLDNQQSAPTWEEVKAEIDNPTPIPEPTVEEKLASVGLSLEELKAAILGGN